jgi:hypothetical protein
MQVSAAAKALSTPPANANFLVLYFKKEALS